ncbi:PREDICTED: uncharacterized protein LOC104808229 [Tarenaya hassleriana]|uniref:uncharacterized protein LOC104808229 n=1 Tax=Tarenaya hassleriana TaxID=28532 RepID=UPI00053C5507|nr:PREDICTED: uncharacterized protein LOC104808229 [Tarenaya hassleriana]
MNSNNNQNVKKIKSLQLPLRNTVTEKARSPVMFGKSAEKTTARKLESKPSMDVDECAEAFIRKFRQQLLLQRLESMENYEKTMARGL